MVYNFPVAVVDVDTKKVKSLTIWPKALVVRVVKLWIFLDVEEGKKFIFDKVVALENDGLTLGTPYVDGAKVTCKVEKQGKEKKIRIFKYKAKKGSTRRRQGHRQPYTKLTVESIEA